MGRAQRRPHCGAGDRLQPQHGDWGIHRHRANGCYSTEIPGIYRENGKITVVHTDWEAGEGAVCTLALVNPAHLVVLPRSDEPVEFSAQVQVLK